MINMNTMSSWEIALGLPLGAVFAFVYFLTRRKLHSKKRLQIRIKTWDKFMPCWSLIGAVFMFTSVLHKFEEIIMPFPKGVVSPITFLVDVIGLVLIIIGVLEIKGVKNSWKCNCGKTNEMNVPKCPECGTKREFLLSVPNRS